MNHFALSVSLLSIKLKWIECNLVIPQISTLYSVGSLQISCVLLIPLCCSLSSISRHAGQEERRAALRYVSYHTRPGAAGTVRQGSPFHAERDPHRSIHRIKVSALEVVPCVSVKTSCVFGDQTSC